MSTQEIKHNVDIERLVTVGRAAIEAREAEKREKDERKEIERVEQLRQDWKPYVDTVLDCMSTWFDIGTPTEADSGVFGEGWSITIPDAKPEDDGHYRPLTIMFDKCTFIYAWTNNVDVAFEATEPQLYQDDDDVWKAQLRVHRWNRNGWDIRFGESDLTVAIARAHELYGAWLKTIAESNRRNAEPRKEEPSSNVRFPLVEATEVLQQLVSDGPSTSQELWQVGMLAALVAIAERTGNGY